MAPDNDTSQLIETQKAIEHAIEVNKNDWRQTIVMILTVIGMAVGAALWATSAHAEIKDWTAEQDFVTKTELTEIIKEQYVKREDFVVVKANLKNLCEKHDQLLNTLEKMDRKLDRLENNNR